MYPKNMGVLFIRGHVKFTIQELFLCVVKEILKMHESNTCVAISASSWQDSSTSCFDMLDRSTAQIACGSSVAGGWINLG